METDRAKRLNTVLDVSIDVFLSLCKEDAKNTISRDSVTKSMKWFQDTDFDFYYQEFIDELNENIEVYRDIELIDNYIECNFTVVEKAADLTDCDNKKIIRNNFEVKFLLSVRRILEFNLFRISNIIYSCDMNDRYSDELIKIFEDKMKQLDPDFITSETEVVNVDMNIFKINNRFNFVNLKDECDKLETSSQKVNLINERLLDFYQWQIMYDNINSPNKNIAYLYSNTYYPNLVKLCEFELKRFEFGSVDSLKTDSSPVQIVKSDFCWNATHTDLLELVTALFLDNAVKHKDGSVLKRKELMDYFQDLFGMDIKNVEVKLARATNRNDKTPFLDRLTLAFENYAEEKEVKQMKRK